MPGSSFTFQSVFPSTRKKLAREASVADAVTLLKGGKKIFMLVPLSRLNWDEAGKLTLYRIFFVTGGKVAFESNGSRIEAGQGDLLFLTPQFLLAPVVSDALRGWAILFHSDFYCLEKHQQEVGCNGILFNNSYQPLPVRTHDDDQQAFIQLIQQLKEESLIDSAIRQEALVAYLKLFLIRASRIKLRQHPHPALPEATANLPENLLHFQQLLEENFHLHRSPSYYARKLHITPYTLNRLTKKYYRRPVSRFIYDRIILEAKKELYLTQRSVKEIAFMVGFEDEFFFSRIFKKYTGRSPSEFRKEHRPR